MGPYYVKFRINSGHGEQEWFFQILPESLPGQFISSVEVGYLHREEDTTIHRPLMRQPFFAHGKQIHTLCSLVSDGLEVYEREP